MGDPVVTEGKTPLPREVDVCVDYWSSITSGPQVALNYKNNYTLRESTTCGKEGIGTGSPGVVCVPVWGKSTPTNGRVDRSLVKTDRRQPG